MEEKVRNLIKEMEARLAKTAMRSYSNFCIGITNDVEQGLFQRHNVSKDMDWWIYVDVGDVENARQIAQYFLEKGMRGNDDKGNEHSTIVYCYVVTQYTMESFGTYKRATI